MTIVYPLETLVRNILSGECHISNACIVGDLPQNVKTHAPT